MPSINWDKVWDALLEEDLKQTEEKNLAQIASANAYCRFCGRTLEPGKHDCLGCGASRR